VETGIKNHRKQEQSEQKTAARSGIFPAAGRHIDP
jgi:hypothetical protein